MVLIIVRNKEASTLHRRNICLRHDRLIIWSRPWLWPWKHNQFVSHVR